MVRFLIILFWLIRCSHLEKNSGFMLFTSTLENMLPPYKSPQKCLIKKVNLELTREHSIKNLSLQTHGTLIITPQIVRIQILDPFQRPLMNLILNKNEFFVFDETKKKFHTLYFGLKNEILMDLFSQKINPEYFHQEAFEVWSAIHQTAEIGKNPPSGKLTLKNAQYQIELNELKIIEKFIFGKLEMKSSQENQLFFKLGTDYIQMNIEESKPCELSPEFIRQETYLNEKNFKKEESPF